MRIRRVLSRIDDEKILTFSVSTFPWYPTIFLSAAWDIEGCERAQIFSSTRSTVSPD